MTLHRTETLRNFGIIAHVDAGKTTLTERILKRTGRIHREGEVHHGNTTTDHHAVERRHGITVSAAAVSAEHRAHRLCLIDTPGHVDFTLEVERALRVLDGAVVVLDGRAGVEPQTETVWRQADDHGVPRIVFVNKLDQAGADFGRCLAQLASRFAVRVAPVAIPLRTEQDRLERSVDLVAGSFGGLCVEARRRCEAARAALVELASEWDDGILEDALEERAVDGKTLRRALREGFLAGRFVPALGGSAFKHVGVDILLDAIVDYLPSPLDVASEVLADPRGPLAALVFKVAWERHGAIAFVRVARGTLRKGMSVLVVGAGETRRVGRLVRLFADANEEVEQLRTGEIGAIVGLPVPSGETLTALEAPLRLEPIRDAQPVLEVALEPVSRPDRERLGEALSRLSATDTSLRRGVCPDTGQARLAGMGLLHLQIAVERLLDEHGVRVRLGPPRVRYRETLLAEATHTHLHRKQSGGPGQFAKLTLRVGPGQRGSGFRFQDLTTGGVIPKEFVSAVEKGVREMLSRGVRAGHPIVDVHVDVLDGATHPNDSSEMAFKLAAMACFEAAARAAGVALLEPILRVKLHAPEGSVGTVLGDLRRRRGTTLGVSAEAGETTVLADLPLSESFGYVDALRSMTQGRGRATLEPKGYALASDAR